jgi:outer membrane lipoprotein SlyB
MTHFLLKTLPISVLLLSACAQNSGWAPTVDTYNNPNAHRLNQDMNECEQLARQSAGDTIEKAAIGTGAGAVIGAGTGAAIGAGTGAMREGRTVKKDAGKGAMIGGALGAVTGGIQQGLESDSQYKKMYSDCLRHRGHRVLERN